MFEVNSRSGLQVVNGRFVKKRLRRPSLVSSFGQWSLFAYWAFVGKGLEDVGHAQLGRLT